MVAHFHFPREKELLSKWKKFIGSEAVRLRRGSYLCSQHFHEVYFTIINSEGKLVIRANAVPTIRVPGHSQEIVLREQLLAELKRRKPKRRQVKEVRVPGGVSRVRFAPRTNIRLGAPVLRAGLATTPRGRLLTKAQAFKRSLLVVSKLPGASITKALLLQAAFNRSVAKHVGFLVNHTVNLMCYRHVRNPNSKK